MMMNVSTLSDSVLVLNSFKIEMKSLGLLPNHVALIINS